LHRILLALPLALLALTAPASAQFTGPSARGQEMTVAAATAARPGTYVTLSGNIVAHLRGDYFQFRDASGEVRVEFAEGVWGGRPVSPESRVRLVGEVDRGAGGTVYVWIKSLDILP
jgi:uncharacterized protein (TIGR00156 family)